jgi:glycosyltransferase involved in cell wall biosynthesis
MAAGLPVINTSLPTGVPWVSLHGKTGMTVAPGDVESLSQAMQTMAESAELRKAYGLKARERALSMFTIHEYARRVQEGYREILPLSTAPVPDRPVLQPEDAQVVRAIVSQ